MLTPSWWKREVAPGDTGPDVAVILRKLGLQGDTYDSVAVARVRGLARQRGVWDHHGRVDEVTASWLGPAEVETRGLIPEWMALRPGDTGGAVAMAARLLGLSGDTYTPEMEDAVRRLQSSTRLDVTGVINEDTARLLGEA